MQPARQVNAVVRRTEAKSALSFHTYWGVKPADGLPGMPLADLLARLAGAFPVHTFDPEGGRRGALERLAALQAVTNPVAMPEEMLAYYRNAYPVDVVLADGPSAGAAVLTFTVWPEPGGVVSRVLVRFATEGHQRTGFVLLGRVADALGWMTEDVSDEVE